ncbi:hypothetical protein CRYUN_Cryun19dG0097300 [Craigia yunnanensis]
MAEEKVIASKASLHFIDRASPSHDLNFYTDGDEMMKGTAGKKKGDEVLHVELYRWADIMVSAPSSANTLGKIAARQLCDSLLTCGVRALTMYCFLHQLYMKTFMWSSV